MVAPTRGRARTEKNQPPFDFQINPSLCPHSELATFGSAEDLPRAVRSVPAT